MRLNSLALLSFASIKEPRKTPNLWVSASAFLPPVLPFFHVHSPVSGRVMKKAQSRLVWKLLSP